MAGGGPIGDYLDIADGMTLDGRAGSVTQEQQIDYLARRLAALNRSQAASLRAAQRNRYVWRTSAAVDLEAVALSGVTLRHRSDEEWFSQMSTAISYELTRDDLLAQLSVWTMSNINDSLPQITPDIITILREPDDSYRPGGSPDSYTPVPPWEDSSPPPAGGQTRPYSAGDDPGGDEGGPEPGGTDGRFR